MVACIIGLNGPNLHEPSPPRRDSLQRSYQAIHIILYLIPVPVLTRTLTSNTRHKL